MASLRSEIERVFDNCSGDVILVAGKGHETYQIIGETTIHFDDREEVIEAFAKL